MNAALLYATQLLAALPSLIASGANIIQMVQDGSARLQLMAAENRDPTAEEWVALNTQIVALRSQLHS